MLPRALIGDFFNDEKLRLHPSSLMKSITSRYCMSP